MINEENFKKNVAKNLIKYRKVNNLTQLELAEKLNYSDKAISKWERGESLPDLYTLSIIASFYQVSLDELVGEEVIVKPIERKERKGFKHIFITLLSVGLVWFVFTLTYTFLKIFLPDLSFAWEKLFLYALTTSFIVMTVFSYLWFNNIVRGIAVSLLIWSLAVSIYCSIDFPNIDKIFFVALTLQVLVVLWFILVSFVKIKKDA